MKRKKLKKILKASKNKIEKYVAIFTLIISIVMANIIGYYSLLATPFKSGEIKEAVEIADGIYNNGNEFINNIQTDFKLKNEDNKIILYKKDKWWKIGTRDLIFDFSSKEPLKPKVPELRLSYKVCGIFAFSIYGIIFGFTIIYVFLIIYWLILDFVRFIKIRI